MWLRGSRRHWLLRGTSFSNLFVEGMLRPAGPPLWFEDDVFNSSRPQHGERAFALSGAACDPHISQGLRRRPRSFSPGSCFYGHFSSAGLGLSAPPPPCVRFPGPRSRRETRPSGRGGKRRFEAAPAERNQPAGTARGGAGRPRPSLSPPQRRRRPRLPAAGAPPTSPGRGGPGRPSARHAHPHTPPQQPLPARAPAPPRRPPPRAGRAAGADWPPPSRFLLPVREPAILKTLLIPGERERE